MGNVLQAGSGQNTARQAVLKTGLPFTVSAMVINKVCGSALKTVQLPRQAILARDPAIIMGLGPVQAVHGFSSHCFTK